MTVAKAYRLLRSIMGTAVEDGMVRQNPCRIRGGGIEASPERPIASVAEIYSIAGKIHRYRELVLLAMFCSLRCGELVGPRRATLDLGSRVVRVEEVVVETSHGLGAGPPKSGAGRRAVAVPDAGASPDLRVRDEVERDDGNRV